MALAAVGGAAGLLLAPWGTQLLLSLAPESVRRTGVHTNGRVLLFTLAASVIASLLAGLLPALRVTPENLSSGLKESGRSGRSSKASASATASPSRSSRSH